MRLICSPRPTPYLNSTKATSLKMPTVTFQPWLLCFRVLLEYAEGLLLLGHHLREMPAGLLVANSFSTTYNNCFLSHKPQVIIMNSEHLTCLLLTAEHGCGHLSLSQSLVFSNQTHTQDPCLLTPVVSNLMNLKKTACYWRREEKEQETRTRTHTKPRNYWEYLRTGKRWLSERIWFQDDG